ncbi:hypothetical protein [Rhizobium leguminosarum]
MAIEREVLEFVIVPPYNERDAICRAKERFTSYLIERFPGYDFKVVPVAPVDDGEDFNVIPVMSFIDDEGRMRLCVYPKLWFMAAIARACAEFDVGEARSREARGKSRLSLVHGVH